MSGICVLIRKSGGPAEARELEAMARPVAGGRPFAARVSGPAGVAYFDAFGGDPEAGVFEDDRYLVAVDGETYNHRDYPEGRREGFSEAALVAALFRRHGKDWWKGVHGTYGAFVWDKQESRGWAFRDRIGVKPLAYWESDGAILVASRMKSIWSAPGFRKEVDPQAIYSYLNMEAIPTPFSIFRGLKKLESGFVLEASPSGTRTEEAWTMTFPPDKIRDEAEIKERIYACLKESVRLQSAHAEPLKTVGAFLSGGTDSSSIAGLLAELYPGDVRTFSMGFDEAGFDESYYSRLASKAFGTDHQEYYVTPGDILSALPSIVAAYDEPFANSSAIPSYYCAKLAKDKGMRVMLGGDGGDEIFGGNSRYRSVFQGSNRLPPWLVKGVLAPGLAVVPRALKRGKLKALDGYVLRQSATFAEKVHGFGLTQYIDVEDIHPAEFLGRGAFKTPAQITQDYFDRAGTPDDLDKFLYNDIKLTLMDNDLPKINRMTELAGIKVRYPFLDYALVELTGRIPVEQKVKGDRLRHVFKEAMRRLLPEEIIEKKKHGFGIPVARWLMRPGKLNDLAKDVLFDPRTAQRGFFRKPFVERLYRLAQEDKTTFFGTYLYYVLFLEMWMREHVDGAVAGR